MLSSRSLKSAVLGLAVLAPALLGGCDRQSGEKAQPAAAPSSAAAAPEARGQLDTSHKGEALPAVTLRDAAGRKLALASLAGKPLLVNLWATWCAPCVAELPALARLSQRVPGMTVLAVDVTRGSTPQTAGDFLKSHQADALDTLVDTQAVMMRQFKAYSLPVTLLIDPQGRIIAKAEGPAEWDAADAVAYFRKLTGG